MKWLWWFLGFIAFVVFLYFTALPNRFPAGRDDDTGIAGTYTMNGLDDLGTEYSGTVTIVAPVDGGDYRVEWIITGAIQQGTGRLVGDTFTVIWATETSAAAATGRSIYTVGADGSLTGERFVDGIDQPATETLYPAP